MRLVDALHVLHNEGLIDRPHLPGMLIRDDAALSRLAFGDDTARVAGDYDTDDPATQGCLVHMLRQALSDPSAYVRCERHVWLCGYGSHAPDKDLRLPMYLWTGPTPGEALAAALTWIARRLCGEE